jgi:hypothetical protein
VIEHGWEIPELNGSFVRWENSSINGEQTEMQWENKAKNNGSK